MADKFNEEQFALSLALAKAQGGGGGGGAEIDDTTTSETKTWSSYKINSEVGKKQDAFVEVTGTLAAGQTSITLTSEAITANSNIIPMTNPEVWHNSISATTGSVTITFAEQASDISVKAVIF